MARRTAENTPSVRGGVGALLRARRLEAHLTQEALAERAGLSARGISDIERGLRFPRKSTLLAVAEVCALSAFERAALLSARADSAALQRPTETTPAGAPTTTDLLANVRRRGVGTVGGCSSPPSNSHRVRRSALPLVGREAALSHLQGVWRAARHGPLLVLVAGDPGIGKTRLVEEMLARVGRHRAVTATASCSATFGAPSYAPVAAWLRSKALWPSVLALDALWLTEIVRLVPEVLLARPATPPPAPLTEPTQLQRLFEALRYGLTATGQPLALLLDDIHQADRETLAWLHFLMRSEMPAPLLVIATLRSGEQSADDLLQSSVADLRARGQVIDVDLAPLTPSQVAQLAEEILQRPPSRSASARLVEETEGNPLFVIELVRAGYVDRWEREDELKTDVSLISSTTVVLPPSLRAAIAVRLTHLSPLARQLAGLAATVGREFSLEVLERASGQSEDDVVSGIEELLQHRIIREHSVGGYTFAHEKIREVAYGELSAARRRRLHRQVARALDTAPDTPLDAVSGELAMHYLQGGETERAITRLEQAGDHARGLAANTAAMAYYSEAVTRLDGLPRPHDRARVREKLGSVLFLLGRFKDAVAVSEQAAAAYGEAADIEGEARVMSQLAHVVATAGLLTDESMAADLEDRLRSLWARAEGAGSQQATTLVLSGLAILVMVRGRYAEMLTATTAGLAAAQRVGDDRLLCLIMAEHAEALQTAGAWDRATIAAEETIELARRCRLWEPLACVLHVRMLDCLHKGDLPAARQYASQGYEKAERAGDLPWTSFFLSVRAEVAVCSGDWVEARQLAEEGLAQGRMLRLPRMALFPLLALGRLLLACGETEEAQRHLDEVIAIAGATNELLALRYAQSSLAEAETLSGAAAARTRLAPLYDERSAREWAGNHVVPALAWALVLLGERTEAAQVLTAGMQLAQARQDRLTMVDLLRVQAWLGMARHEWDQASALLDDALAIARAMPYPYAEAKALWVYGRLGAARGDLAAAREHFTQALAICSRLGEGLYRPHIDRDLATL